MKALPVLVLCMLLAISVQAQFGVNGKYLIPSEDTWSFTSSRGEGSFSSVYDKGWSAGLDYWFRLKNKRIEFLPEVNVAQLTSSEPGSVQSETSIYSFVFNTNFYFWDFTGDCDCPTFSKQGPTLEKGLFIQVSPGISYWDAAFQNSTAAVDDGVLAFSIGGGIGFDLGINDLVTFTPMLNVRYYPEVSLEGNLLNPVDSSEPTAISATESPLIWSAGFRIGFRLDNNY